MPEQRVYVGDVGTKIKIDMQEDVSSGSGFKFWIRKPQGQILEKTATLSGTDYLEYDTIAGDQDQDGEYAVQPQLTLGGWTGRGNTVSYSVYPIYT